MLRETVKMNSSDVPQQNKYTCGIIEFLRIESRW